MDARRCHGLTGIDARRLFLALGYTAASGSDCQCLSGYVKDSLGLRFCKHTDPCKCLTYVRQHA